MINQLSRVTFTDDKALQELQQYVQKLSLDLIADGVLTGKEFTLTFSGAGTQVITHNLGRPAKGIIILSSSAGVSYSDDLAGNPPSTVSLTSSGAATVKVRVI